MGPTGRLVTIKRSGVDGPHFPLSLSTCLFGRGIECDIRIQLPVVSKQHCKIEISGQKATLFNFSATNPTQVNGSVIDEPVQLKHGDMITIVDRSFRYENESQTTEFPGQRREQVSPHQGPRSDFSSDPDGNVQDPNTRSEVTEEGVSGPVHAEGVGAAHGIPRASGEPGARKTPDVPSSALPGDDGKNAAGPTASEFREDSSVTSVSGSGELTCPSTRCLEKCGENESPFRKLYESLKEELDVKSEKENVLQNRRRSGSRSHRTTDNGSAVGSQGAAQLWVSPKPGRRSGPRSQSEVGSASGDRGRGRTEARRTDVGPAQTPRDAVGPRVAPRELTKSESPAPCLQQNSSRPGPGGDRSRGGDSVSLSPHVSLGAGGGLSAPERILTRTQTQTATRDDGADKSRNTPEKASSKKRRSSVPADADMLAVDAETQAPAPLSPLRAQAERKVPDSPLSTPEPLDVSNSAEDVNKMEGVPSKRRRVSFGGHLRPELFDENLPPNTPLKRGETPTKRRSLGTHTPAVLKKIIKEQPPPSGKDDASEIRLGTPAQNALPSLPARTPTGPAAAHTHGARPLPSGPPCAQGTDLPRSGGRRSSGRPPRPSMGRSQLELLQAIHSKRRSGASEANLIVAKSWADVVRLSAKQAQTKVAKRSAQRPPSKRQRRSNMPKKPVGSVHHPSSTGHANSPCTIVIGKAHLEKVNAPARPCRMLNSFIFSRKADFNEDLSGLTEMFKTPAKEKVQMTSICPTTFSNSEDLLRKMFAVPSSEEETLLRTTKNTGEAVSPSTRNAPEEPSEETSTNSAFRRQRFIVNGEMGRAPPEAEPLRPASSADKLRRSAELGNARTPGAEGEHGVTEASAVEDTWGGRLGRTPSREQKPEAELKESARSFETCRKSNRSEENSEKAAAARRSRASELRRALRPEDPVALGRPHDTDPAGARGSHGPLRIPGHAREPGDTESRTTTVGSQPPEPEPFRTPAQGNVQVKTPSQKVSVEVLSAQRKRPHTPGESTNTPGEPEGDEKDVTACEDTPEQKRNPAEHAAGSRRRPRTPKRKVQALEDLAGFRELLQTPDHTVDAMTDVKTKTPCRSPQAEPVTMPTGRKSRAVTSLGKVEMDEDISALRNPTPTPGETTRSHGEAGGDDKDISHLKQTPEQKVDPAENAAGSKRRPRTPKRKEQPLGDLAGFTELLQTPDPTLEPATDDKTNNIPCRSPQVDPVITSTVMTRGLKTLLQKVDVEEALLALRKSPRAPGGTTCSPREPAGDEKVIELFQATPELKPDPAENAAGSRRRPRTPKRKVQHLEDLAGFRELFQTPDRTLEPVTDDKTKTPCKSPQAEPLITSTVRTRGLKTLLQKVDVEEALSALRKSPRAPGGTTCSPREPAGDEKITKAFKATPKQKLELTENVTGSRRRPRTPKGKVQPLEDLAGIEELFRTPDHTVAPVTDDKTQILCRSPRGEPVNTSTSRKSHRKTPLEKGDIEEEPLAPRKPTPTPGGTTHLPREPGDDKGIRAFKATPEQKLELTEIVIGSRRRPRTPQGKAPAPEDLAGIEELFRTPDHTVAPVTDDKAQIPCKSPQAEPAGRKKRPGKVDIEVEPSALKKPTRTSRKTTSSHREPKGDDEDIKLFKKTSEQKAGSAENVTRSKRRPRAPKEMARAVGALAGLVGPFQTSDHTDGPGTDDRAAKTLRQSSRPELGIRAASKKRQGKAPTREEDVEEEEPAAPRKSTRTSGKTTRSHRAAVGGNKKASVSQETVAQRLGPAGNAVGSRRRLRTRTEQPPPPEDRPGCQELIAAPGQDEAPGSDAESARRDPAPTRDKRKPARTSRRVPRALSVEATEDPARSPNGSVSRSPTRERGKDENLAGAKRLRTRTCPPDAAEDPPLQKRQRTAPRDRRPPPGPAVTDRRSQRLSAERTDLPSSTVSIKNKRQKAEVMAPPEKAMSLRSRRPNKTSGVEQGPGFTSAEKAPTRRNVKKTPNTSQEMKLRNLEDGAEDPAPGGQAQGGGARPRPGRQRRVPAGAAGEAGDSRAGVHGDAREEKEGAKRSGRGCLRPRKVAAPPAGDTLENEPKQRVTRSAKRSAESLTKENDNVCVRKMRTRSHRDNEDI
ncbi:proliferation marker protein Ki-67 isoform X2 [Pteropus alecto]|uniref:proliferation marker protein Ki-67 isoform X2 n=1 Tax=Pteropus alecto TaxID=9402 RepID=UPI000D5367E7|nr:proliferation marker protein Ki-67 isoform X2 [Pteropus alecto]